MLFARLARSRALRNTTINYFGIVWRAALSILLIPVYVHRMAPQEWGIVAVCIALQGFLALLDAGLSQIIPRDIARAEARSSELLSKIFTVFSKAYFFLAAIGFCLGQFVIPSLIGRGLKLDEASSVNATVCFELALLMFFFQFWNTVHIGFWNGTQEQHLANIRQIVFATLKHGSAVALVLIWAPTALSYMIAFAVFTVAEWIANRMTISRRLQRSAPIVTTHDLKALTREVGILSIGVLMGVLVSQMDR
ncbi:MAG: wzx, partial [Polaromonas sp.]|nr:wzx [Polaromonas sp.]